jgi:hypothetical protein
MTNNISISGINQFKESYIEKLKNSIEGDDLGPSVSLCHQCYYHIPAWRYHKNGEVFLVKHCAVHGITHHKIESDYEFYSNLNYTQDTPQFNFNASLLTEASDRCNLECPHCYHLPDSDSSDIPLNDFINRIKQYPLGKGQIERIVLTGAEATLRKDFVELVSTIKDMGLYPVVMSNAIRFGDKNFIHKVKDAGIANVNVGLNHPEYIDHETVRRKQVTALNTMHEIGLTVGYIGYTMIDLSELDFILSEVVNSPWYPKTFRIRAGSEIGRNGTDGRVYLSDIFKATKKWAEDNNKNFKVIGNADDNIYHIMVELEGKIVRLIQWCDITDIDMEELRSGPWCDFVPDGITNFLHQIIRRDIWKNQGKLLPDTPPKRYQFSRYIDINEPLDFSKLY